MIIFAIQLFLIYVLVGIIYGLYFTRYSKIGVAATEMLFRDDNELETFKEAQYVGMFMCIIGWPLVMLMELFVLTALMLRGF